MEEVRCSNKTPIWTQRVEQVLISLSHSLQQQVVAVHPRCMSWAPPVCEPITEHARHGARCTHTRYEDDNPFLPPPRAKQNLSANSTYREDADRRGNGENRPATAHPEGTSSSDATDSTILPPAQQRAVGIRGGGGGGSGSAGFPARSPSSPEIVPLKTLEELLAYEKPGWGCGFAPKRPLPFVATPFPPLKSRLLVCHDLAGGYGEDKLVQGGGYQRPYRMYDWGLIDIFVYFRLEARLGYTTPEVKISKRVTLRCAAVVVFSAVSIAGVYRYRLTDVTYQ